MRDLQRVGSVSRQRGFTLWALVLNLSLLAFVFVLVVRILPNYLAYLNVKDVVVRAAADFDRSEDTLQDLRRKISKLMTTNQVEALTPEDIEVYRQGGRVYINANYEARFSVAWIIDGVMVFDDLTIEAGPSAVN